jgi:AraC family transcriptional regulator of adaptative response/methylated-DNA-[protein]-cysteine methyltransferase
MNHDLPDLDIMYDAFLRKDSTYDGIFFVAVRTTGIFCRPTCPARKPKRENIEFYGNSSDALHAGYRPCKICRPMACRGEVPDWLRPLLAEVDASPDIRLKDADLRARGLDPNRVRRWFRRHHGMTFQGYQRALRVGQAFGRIRHGEKVIDAAFESGYESLSGFTESFKKMTSFSPKESSRQCLITVTRLPTPLGPMLAGATDEGVCLLEFLDRRMLETQLARLTRRLRAGWLPGNHRHLDALRLQLDEYFTGTRTAFALPLVLAGTPFQEAVWRELQTIPYGETRSYQSQAERLGRPAAVRAVARANGDNRLAILIPCHRVIGKNGQLTGYGGGLWRKRHLLNLEREKRHTAPVRPE